MCTATALSRFLLGFSGLAHKTCFFSVPVLLVLVSGWSIAAPLRVKLLRLAGLLSMFLLPLVIWLFFVSARFGFAEVSKQLSSFGGFIGLYSGHMQEAQPLYQLKSIGNPFSIARLISRLQDPRLEWSQTYYTLGT